MKHMLLTVLVFFSLGLTASALKPIEAPQVDFALAEFSSALSPDVSISFELQEFSREQLERLAREIPSEVSLVRVDGEKAVPIRALIEKQSMQSVGPARLVVLPVSILETGWYELRIRAKEITGALASPRITRFADGSIGTRIRVGSGPVVARIEVCPGSEPDRTRVRVVFSEPVGLAPSARLERAIVLTADSGERLACRDASASYPDVVTARVSAGDASSIWELECASFAGTSRIAITDAVVGIGGAPVMQYGPAQERAGLEVELERSDVRPEAGCLVVRALSN
jgi:hypothetical protein